MEKKNEKKQREKLSVLESGGLIWLNSSAAFLVLHYKLSKERFTDY